MPNLHQIRLSTLADKDAIIQFQQAMARETEQKELDQATISAGVHALFQRPTLGFYVVATVGDDMAGSLMITTEWTDWRNGLFWWIQSVYVRPEFRRQGIYRKLYQFVQQRAAIDREVRGFRLYVEKENHVAQRTYRNLGMQESCYQMFEAGVEVAESTGT